MKNKNLSDYVIAFVNGLITKGISEVVISPGSRSTPLAITFAEHPKIHTYINIDERSAGFFALGLAKKQRKPIALLCTSGTAAANYYPAIIEAHYSRIPLVILTADRPHELRDIGAPQAINQIHLYSNYVKWFVDCALPESSQTMLLYIKNIAQRAVQTANENPKGPVHINLPFREPLLPDLSKIHQLQKSLHIEPVVETKKLVEHEQIERIVDEIDSSEKGLIVCGELHNKEFREQVLGLAEKLKFPILADPLSNLRFGEHSKHYIIDCYDSILKTMEKKAYLKPDVVLRFGAMPVSKPLFLLLRDHPEIKQIVVDGDGGYRDPTLSAEHVHSDEAYLCEMLIKKCKDKQETSWCKKWKQVNNLFREYLSTPVIQEDSLFEGTVYVELQKLLPDRCNVFVGNSMPIRDVDTFFHNSDKNITVYANRGANGIDGVVSTALGVSAASHEKTILIIGDLSFYHDLNGLLAAKQNKLNLTVLLINNNGGGIFSFLSQADEKTHFEQLFGTPTNLDFQYAASLYSAHYKKISTWEEFRTEFQFCMNRDGLNIIEIPTNRHKRVNEQRKWLRSVSWEIERML